MVETAEWKQPFHKIRRLLAKIWLKLNPQITAIGITGSFGKTNTTRAITQVLSEKYNTLQTDLNLDTVYNLPITILKIRPWHQKLVLEMGVDHKGEMDLHLSLVKPKIAVITGINPTHSDPELLGSLGGIIKEKGKLLQALSSSDLAILNGDDPNVCKMSNLAKAKIIWYGTSPKLGLPASRQFFWADNIKVSFSGTAFTLHSKKENIVLKTGLIGRHFVHSCLAAAAVGINEDLNWEEIKVGLEKLQPLTGRVNIEKGPNGSILINDSLRANPASTMAGLQVLADLPISKQGKRIAVLGEMGELGSMAKKGHIEVGKRVAELKIDYLVTVGPLTRFLVEEAQKRGMMKNHIFWTKDVKQSAEKLKMILKKNDLFYLKGSLLRHLERIPMILEGEQVGCVQISCHNYCQCQGCPRLQRTF